MRAVLAAVGSRGDVTPFAVLAQALLAKGHHVTIVSHASHGHLIPAGVEFLAAPSDPQELLAGPATRALRSGNLRDLVEHRDRFADFLTSFTAPTQQALATADVLVASTLAIPSVHLAVRSQVPVVRAHTWPQTAASFGPLPLLRHSWRLPGVARWAGRRALEQAEMYLAGVSGRWEGKRLVLTGAHPVTLTTHTHGALHAYSATVAERPDPGAVVTGWWQSAGAGTLSERTSQILAGAGPWIAVGFGSMPDQPFQHTLGILDQALDRIGVRAVIQADRPLEVAGLRAYVIGEEPHSQLFRRVDAVIHHGGAGTTGAAVLAGVPSVMIPYFADQHYWAHRAHHVGVATRPLPNTRVTSALLAQRLQQALTTATRRRARMVGETVGREPGVHRAVEYLEHVIEGAPSTRFWGHVPVGGSQQDQRGGAGLGGG